jgi:CubicO group peptidase (beta-lactamase class C family)
VDQNLVSVNTLVVSMLPDFPSKNLTVAQLLNHTAGFTPFEPLWNKMLKEDAEFVGWGRWKKRETFRKYLGLEFPKVGPAEYLYSDMGYFWLGFLIEEILKQDLDEAMKKWVFVPFGLKESFFEPVLGSPNTQRNENCAATEDSLWRGGILQGQVHDPNAWALGGVAGNAGVFSTATDVVRLVLGWRSGLISQQTQDLFFGFKSVGLHRLGWDTTVLGGSSAGKFASLKTFGHLGYSGCSTWWNQGTDQIIVLLTNRMHSKDDPLPIRKLRPLFHDAINEDLVKNRF